MVEQVAADAGRLLHHVDTVLGKMVAIADARQHQQLRAVDRSPAQHHLTAGRDDTAGAELLEFHTGGTFSVEDHPCRAGFGMQRQIRPAQRGFEVCVSCAPPRSPALCDAGFAKAFGCVEAFRHGSQPGCRRTPGTALGRDDQRAVLNAVEVFLDVGVAPLLAGLLGPLVVVGGKTTHPHHRVYRRRAAEHLAARPVDLTPVELLLRFRQIVPIHFAAKQFGETRGDVDKLVLVPRTRFEQHNLDGRIRAQPVGHHRSCRARSHNDVVGVHPPESRSPAGVTRSIRPPQNPGHLIRPFQGGEVAGVGQGDPLDLGQQTRDAFALRGS